MTVLLVHNRYQQPGGEDQVYEAERDLLRAHGLEVVTYDVHNDAVHAMGRLSLVLRTLWNWSTYRSIRRLIQDHHPSVVHCHNTFPLVSPSVYWACRKEGVPVVQTLHNYRLTCLNAYLFRDGKVCERCFGRFPWAGLRHRCYRDSLAASCVAALSWFVHFRLLRTYHRAVDRYIALTEFGRVKMLALGLPEHKLVVKPNAIAASAPLIDDFGVRAASGIPRDAAFAQRSESGAALRLSPHSKTEIGHPVPALARPPRVLFVGRLSSEKGVDVLIRAWRLADGRLPPGASLAILGGGPERAALETAAADARSISFEGQCTKAKVLAAMGTASLCVVPSLWYETFGLVVVESLSCGTPVIVSGHGALASLVEDGVTGFHFRPGDASDLADTLVRALSEPQRLAGMGLRAATALRDGDSNPARNVERLLGIYREAVALRRGTRRE